MITFLHSHLPRHAAVARHGAAPRRRRGGTVILAVAVALVVAVAGAPAALAATLAPPSLAGPGARTATTVSLRIYRTPDSGMVCQPDIGYEVRVGALAMWRDVGKFPNAPCDDPDPGYKFTALEPGTSYTFYVRAYREVDGGREYSEAVSLTASTVGAVTPTPTPTPSPEPTPTPSPSPTPTSSPGPEPGALAAPKLGGPSNRTVSTISVRLTRSADAPTCSPDVGYEVRATPASSWLDIGGYSNVCSSTTFGYKFTGLSAGTSYDLTVRAYRVTGGSRQYSDPFTLTAATLANNG